MYVDYETISTHDYCPYIQISTNIKNILEHLSYYADDTIEEAKTFFDLNDPDTFFPNYVSYSNLISIMTHLIPLFK